MSFRTTRHVPRQNIHVTFCALPQVAHRLQQQAFCTKRVPMAPQPMAFSSPENLPATFLSPVEDFVFEDSSGEQAVVLGIVVSPAAEES